VPPFPSPKLAARTPLRPAPKPRGPLRPKTPPLGRPPGKFTQHRKLARLAELLEKHPLGLTIAEIAAALRLTSRSVRRYLSYLKGRDASDALVSTPTGPKGTLRWKMNPRDRGRAMNLRRTQAYGLLCVRHAFDPLRGSALFDEIDIVTQQIIQLAQRPVRTGASDIASDTRMEERFVFVPEVLRGETAQGAELDDVFRAVADLRPLVFRYLPRPDMRETAARNAGRDAPRERGARVTLHPYAMVLYRGAVHCIGRETKSGHVETYALSRMRETEPSESSRFELPDDFDVADFVHGPFGLGRAKHVVMVEFSAQAAAQIRPVQLHRSQRIATAPDGRIRLSVSVPSLEEAAMWVLGFGAAARVVEPPELRDLVMRELKGAMGRYGR
jgi:predicted DNA-binding transcriptional regulator YafY